MSKKGEEAYRRRTDKTYKQAYFYAELITHFASEHGDVINKISDKENWQKEYDNLISALTCTAITTFNEF